MGVFTPNTKDQYGKSQKYIDEAVQGFCHKNHCSINDPIAIELRKKLEAEVLRLKPMVNESIFSERRKRAFSTFVKTLVLGLIFAGILALITGAVFFTAAVILPPIAAAAIAAYASVSTIDISYNSRLKGGISSETEKYQESLRQKQLDAKSKAANISAEQQTAVTTLEKPKYSFVDSLIQQRDLEQAAQKQQKSAQRKLDPRNFEPATRQGFNQFAFAGA